MALAVLAVIGIVVGIIGCVLSILWLVDALADMSVLNKNGRGNMKAQRLLNHREIWGARLAFVICTCGVGGGVVLSVPALIIETRVLITLTIAVLAETIVVTTIGIVMVRKWQAARAVRDDLLRERVH